jgi:putative addiction module killer protein
VIIFKAPEFIEWYTDQNEKTQYIIESRLRRIREDNHWGTTNEFDGLIELKWKSGMRIYTAIVGKITVVILLGGNKNGQSKDIKKAKKILKEVKATHFN